ncbi:MAG: class I SAM-dependent methyltransferase [Helicobacteraceae bacterium]|jgi:23S rRNA (cytosine1962-C5)-methyltransferase|nr:class I SAM-dependent methyltransferase [Helicobacteraceae bacterium]
MTIDALQQLLITNAKNKTEEYTRLFHGRGNFYGAFNFLTVDSADKVLYAAFFAPDDEALAIVAMLQDFYATQAKWQAMVVQRRYLKGAPTELLAGELPEETFAIENGLKYKLNFLNNQNIGFFPDMKIGREFVQANARGKNVLNLFSYTCPFSVAAIAGGARVVVNVDMAKRALTAGRENHRFNDLNMQACRFMPYNILKSWSRIKKGGPYDLIIIDPPSFQRGSFAATTDYQKIIRRLKDFAAEECTVLSALNAPELDTNFIKTLFEENAPDFTYVKRLENLDSFPCDDTEKSLKNLIFKKGKK